MSVERMRRGKKIGDLKALIQAVEKKPKVLVVGAGGSARYLERGVIDFNEYTVISCNSACLLVYADIWMSFDCESWRDTWWGEKCANFYLLGERQVERAEGWHVYFPHDYYTFNHGRSIRTDGLDKFEPMVLKGGATITGCAVQLAMSFKTTTHLHLTGLDFYDLYSHFYDDDKERSKRGKPWAQSHIARMTWLLKEAEAMGIEVKHFGMTALNIFGIKEIL